MGCRTICRTLIPNLEYEAFLIGIKLQDQDSPVGFRV